MTKTPWGKAQTMTLKAEGIYHVTTASHGGFKLDRARNKQVHASWRRIGGWYEEDLDWAIVVFTFPTVEPNNQHLAAQTLRDNFPHAYMAVTGKTLTAADSYRLAEEEFERNHVQDWVATSAIREEDLVLVSARCGNSRKVFRVAKERYCTSRRFAYVIDLTVDQEV